MKPDLGRLVFLPSSGTSVLEQLVLASAFRGGQTVVDAPHGYRLIEQPIVCSLANQLALFNLAEAGLTSWLNVAGTVASATALIVPPIEETYAAALAASSFEDCMQALPDSGNRSMEILEHMKEMMSICAHLRVPEAIRFFRGFLSSYVKPDDPFLAAEYDFLRRVAEKSLQDTTGSARDATMQLIRQYEKDPSLLNARKVDVFARFNAFLNSEGSGMFVTRYPGVEEPAAEYQVIDPEAIGFLEDAREVYRDLLSRSNRKGDPDDQPRQSLIAFSMAQGDLSSANAYLQGRNQRSKTYSVLRFLMQQEEIRNSIKPNTLLRTVGLGGEYDAPMLLKLVGSTLRYARDHPSAPHSTVLAFEDLIRYSKKTALREVRYQEEDGLLCRYLIFNQDPYLSVRGACKVGDNHALRMIVDRDYHGLVKRARHAAEVLMENFSRPAGIINRHLGEQERWIFSIGDMYSDASGVRYAYPKQPRVRITGWPEPPLRPEYVS